MEIGWQNCHGNESRGTIGLKEDTDDWMPEDGPGRYVETGNRSIRHLSAATDMNRVKVPISRERNVKPGKSAANALWLVHDGSTTRD